MHPRPHHFGADIDIVFENGGTGQLPAPWLDADQLAALSEKCRKSGRVITNIEAHEISEEWDTPRIDLGLYNGAAEERARPRLDRVVESHALVAEIVALALAEPLPIRFEVWLERPDDI